MRVLIILLFILTGCGTDHHYDVIEQSQAFEGHYEFINSKGERSFLELSTDGNGNVTFESTGQSLNSINPKNNSTGTHPNITDRNVQPVNGKLILPSRNYNYSSSTHDIEEDDSGSNITGNHRTDITVEKVGYNKIKLTIQIWDGALNNNVNNIIANRTLTSL